MICLAERLKEARKQAGYTQEQLAELVGVSRAAIARFETGEIEPSLKTFLALTDTLGTSADALLGREKKERPCWPAYLADLSPEAAAALGQFICELKKSADRGGKQQNDRNGGNKL